MSWIKNKTELATSTARSKVMEIIEAGYDAIDTEQVIRSAVSCNDEKLNIKGQNFYLNEFDNIYVVGFGKASCQASAVLSDILKDKIREGVAIGLEPVACEFVKTYGGSHPLPSVKNVEISERILKLSKALTRRDLVITVVSGGGSALLCWPMEECRQSNKLYEDFLKCGGNITELNTVRKHISLLKGGGLAKELFPARVIGLIFSDVPGNAYDLIASGPTYKDCSTIKDAQAILDKYGLKGYQLNETPKDDQYFSNVTNVPLVSNDDALAAMERQARKMGLNTEILSDQIYDTPEEAAKEILAVAEPGKVIICGGEPKTIVPKSGGTGGRCQRLGVEILPLLTASDTFAAFASDGLDNSQAAGVIIDHSSQDKLASKKIDYSAHEASWDSLGLFSQLGNELIMTGPTQANVSDLMLLYRE